MQQTFVQSAKGKIAVDIPDSWQVLACAEYPPRLPRGTAEELVESRLRHPTGTSSLTQTLTSDMKVAIIIEDMTRSSPKKEILSGVLAELEGRQIPPENIIIVIALGTHRPLSCGELEKGYGKKIVSKYKVINHDCHAVDLVPVGELKTGRTVKINRHVYDADYRIGIGSIFPHPMNGFGGGGKILFPGVADFNSIFEHHLTHSFQTGASLGTITGNAFLGEIRAMARAGKLDFIVNSVLDHNDFLYDLVCGHPVKAHEKGIDICRGIISSPFPQKADITIISAFPYTEGPQIMKPFAPSTMITRKGGIVILYADCTVPLPEVYFNGAETFRAKYGKHIGRAVLDHFSSKRRLIPDSPPELNMSLAQAMLALNDFKVILVTGDIPGSQIQRLGFIPAESMGAAVEMCGDIHSCPTVNIVPSGGVILPVVG